jgi:hypothetical protein
MHDGSRSLWSVRPSNGCIFFRECVYECFKSAIPLHASLFNLASCALPLSSFFYRLIFITIIIMLPTSSTVVAVLCCTGVGQRHRCARLPSLRGGPHDGLQHVPAGECAFLERTLKYMKMNISNCSVRRKALPCYSLFYHS